MPPLSSVNNRPAYFGQGTKLTVLGKKTSSVLLTVVNVVKVTVKVTVN